MKWGRSFGIVVVLLFPVGCRSVGNLWDEPTVFGGTRCHMQSWLRADVIPHGHCWWPLGPAKTDSYTVQIAKLVALAFDIPLSVAMDLVLLPVTGSFEIARALEEDREEDESP